MSAEQGYQVEPELLDARITTLTALADLTSDLVATASGLAERRPMLGTSPPALELASRLCAAAGQSGLAGEVRAAQREVAEFQQTLAEVNTDYAGRDADAETAVRGAGSQADS